MEVFAEPRGQVLHGGGHQLGLGGEVVELGAAGDAGALGDQGGGRSCVAELDEAVDGGVENLAARLRAAFFVGRHHAIITNRLAWLFFDTAWSALKRN